MPTNSITNVPAPPWKAKVCRGGGIQISNEDGALVLVDVEAHAQAILHAVNSHPQLVDALETSTASMMDLSVWLRENEQHILAGVVETAVSYNKFVLAQVNERRSL